MLAVICSRRLRFVCMGEVGDLAPVSRPVPLAVVAVSVPGGSIRFTLGDISDGDVVDSVDSTHCIISVMMGWQVLMSRRGFMWTGVHVTEAIWECL